MMLSIFSSWQQLVLLSLSLIVIGSLGSEVPTALSTTAAHELDEILRQSQITLPALSPSLLPPGSTPVQAAQDLFVAAQKARIAIAEHFVGRPQFSREAVAAKLKRAKEVQDELMARVEAHLGSQLDQFEGIHLHLEKSLYTGFSKGAEQTKNRQFLRDVLNPPRVRQKTSTKEISSMRERVRIIVPQAKDKVATYNPVSAFRRWRIRRLLNKLSQPPPLNSATPYTNPAPWNIDMLRTRLSTVTAVKSVLGRAAREQARDESAAKALEKAEPIQSDLVLDKPLQVKERKMKKVPVRTAGLSDSERHDGKWQWTNALNKGGIVDWNEPGLIPEPLEIADGKIEKIVDRDQASPRSDSSGRNWSLRKALNRFGSMSWNAPVPVMVN